MGETVHIPFLVAGTMALVAAGFASDHAAPGSASALGIIGVFMFACNVAIFWRSLRHDR